MMSFFSPADYIWIELEGFRHWSKNVDKYPKIVLL